MKTCYDSQVEREKALNLGQIQIDPVKHLEEAKRLLGILIIDNRGLCGEDIDVYSTLCEAQNNINLALEDLKVELSGRLK